MRNLNTNLVTPTDIAHYQRDGVVCLRQLLNAEELDCLRQGIEQNLRSPSPRAKIASRADDPGQFFEDFCNWQENEFYQRFIFESRMGEAAALLMQSKVARLYHDHVLVKAPGTRQRTPWHQDQPYYNITGRQNCSFWIPVDPVPEHASLKLIAGSHLGPWLMPRTFMDQQAKWFPEGSLAELPDIDADPEQFPIVRFAIDPGDVVCFHMLTLHAAPGIDGANKRRVFSLRLLGDDVRHAPRTWVTSPHFSGLDDVLPAGARMEHPFFPVLWQA